MIKGFKNFLMRGDVVVVAIGLIVALALSTLIQSFTANVINPIINRAEGKQTIGLGVQLGGKGNTATFINFGGFISSAIYFLIFMAVVYFAIVIPYKAFSARQAVRSCSLSPLLEDLPGMSVRGLAGCRVQVQALRDRAAGGCPRRASLERQPHGRRFALGSGSVEPTLPQRRRPIAPRRAER